MVNVGGYSSIYPANVYGTGISDLIITGSLHPGLARGYRRHLALYMSMWISCPARYATIEQAVISVTVPRSWLDGHNLAPQDMVIYYLSESSLDCITYNLGKIRRGDGRPTHRTIPGL